MIKKINNLTTVYDGELIVDDSIKKEIDAVWEKFLKDYKKYDFFDGDIYCVTDIDDMIPLINIKKTKYSYLIYAKVTGNIMVRSLFSAGYIKTSDNYIGIILNYRDELNAIGGMASNEDIIDNKYDYTKCFIREFKEELGIDLNNNNNKDFKINLQYLKYPSINEMNESFYTVGTLFEVNTNYTSKDLIDIFNRSEHENEVKELKFYNQDNYMDIYSYDNKADYFEELFNILFK